LLVPGKQPRAEAEALLDLLEERLAVLGVAHRARRDRERALGAERLRLPLVGGEAAVHAGHRGGQEPPARVDSLAEARDPEAPRELVDAPAGDVGDEQARRVGAEVDRRDAHPQRARRNGRARPTVACASCSACSCTSRRARERRRRARAVERRCELASALARCCSIPAAAAAISPACSPSAPFVAFSRRQARTPRTPATAPPATRPATATPSAGQTASM